jgi:hypothetical protein
LYAGGDFTTAGGVAVNRIARWNGAQWSIAGAGVGGGVVYALTVLDDGTRPVLYAGGNFTTAADITANGIANWDGTRWSVLGSGMSGPFVYALTVFDDGRGPTLYAGGAFTRAGGVDASRIAAWRCP